jgi:hypothetical protein
LQVQLDTVRQSDLLPAYRAETQLVDRWGLP